MEDFNERIKQEQLEARVRIAKSMGLTGDVQEKFTEIKGELNIQKSIKTIESSLNKIAEVYGEERLDTIEKSIGHKYFKREGNPGSYKYYYTEADYKAGKSSGEKTETPYGKIDSNNEKGLQPKWEDYKFIIGKESDGRNAADVYQSDLFDYAVAKLTKENGSKPTDKEATVLYDKLWKEDKGSEKSGESKESNKDSHLKFEKDYQDKKEELFSLGDGWEKLWGSGISKEYSKDAPIRKMSIDVGANFSKKEVYFSVYCSYSQVPKYGEEADNHYGELNKLKETKFSNLKDAVKASDEFVNKMNNVAGEEANEKIKTK